MYEIVDSRSGDLLGRYGDAETAWAELREHVRRNPQDSRRVALFLVDDENPLASGSWSMLTIAITASTSPASILGAFGVSLSSPRPHSRSSACTS